MQIKKIVLFALSFLMRSVALFAAVSLFMMAINNVSQGIPKIRNAEKYQELKGYQGLILSGEMETSEENQRKLDKRMADFFRQTNESSGLLFSPQSAFRTYNSYSSINLGTEELTLTDYAISVNNNYLKLNPAYDLNGKPIFAEENALEFKVLVPEKYKTMEQELFEHYTEELTFLHYYNQDLETSGIEGAHEAVHEPLPVEIIFIENGQKFFMYDSSYNKYVNEYIEDPIIKIVTSANVSTPQIPYYVTAQKFVVDTLNNSEIVEKALSDTGLKTSVIGLRSAYEKYSDTLKKTVFTVLLQAVLAAIAMAAAMISVRIAGKNISKKHSIFLLSSWVIIGVPLILWPQLNLFTYTASVLVLAISDITFLLRYVKKAVKY